MSNFNRKDHIARLNDKIRIRDSSSILLLCIFEKKKIEQTFLNEPFDFNTD